MWLSFDNIPYKQLDKVPSSIVISVLVAGGVSSIL